MIRTNARTDPAVTAMETRHAVLSRRAAAQSIVLLKNDGVLPLKPGPIALYGEGARHTVKGGTGSGEVNARRVVNIMEGLVAAGFSVSNTRWLDEYDAQVAQSQQAYVQRMRRRAGLIRMWTLPYLQANPFSPPAGRPLEQADLARDTDTCLYVLARQAGEYADRVLAPGDFLLTETEIANIRLCADTYVKTIVVINAGGMVDLSPLDGLPINAIVFFCQQGSEGGHALADVLSGRVCPSGKLAFTWPKTYEDIPYGQGFGRLPGGDMRQAHYKEGIYVGYRYYDTFGVKPRYSFGFGLSYTHFHTTATLHLDADKATVHAHVTNTGDCAGQEVVQVYVSCPPQGMHKETRRLVGFAKTDILQPGETQDMRITFRLEELGSFDETQAQFVLEPGNYVVFVGGTPDASRAIGALTLDSRIILFRHQRVCVPETPIEELESNRDDDPLGTLPTLTINPDAVQTTIHAYEEPAVPKDKQAEKLLAGLSVQEQAELCVGSGLDLALPKKKFLMVPGAAGYSCDKFERRGIPAISFCDGPAGLRLFDVSVTHGRKLRMVNPVFAFLEVLPWLARKLIFGNKKRGTLLYQYTTAFPVGMALAQTWNQALLEEIGQAVQAEMEAFGAVYWLAPGMNIHRNPLCGRNYEYFSEDPLLSGKLAAALTRGVQQKEGFFVTLKHFCCNNQEDNRMHVSAQVSERALREIYLRGFEIAVREGRAQAVMTSYNRVNGVYAAESHDLCTKVLRNEWGFDGLVMTDWVTESNMLNAAKSMQAGVNVMMPGISSDRRSIRRALKSGALSAKEIARSAGHVLRGVVRSQTFQRYQAEQKASKTND